MYSIEKYMQPAGLADLVDLHDIRVAQRGRRLGLGAEPRPVVHARVLAGEDHLQGRRPSETVMPGLVHDPHGTPAQLAAGSHSPGPSPCAGRRRRFIPVNSIGILARLDPQRATRLQVGEGLLQAFQEGRVEFGSRDFVRLSRPLFRRRAPDQVVELALARRTLLDVRDDLLLSRSSKRAGEKTLQDRSAWDSRPWARSCTAEIARFATTGLGCAGRCRRQSLSPGSWQLERWHSSCNRCWIVLRAA